MKSKKQSGLFMKIFSIALLAFTVICLVLLAIGADVMRDYDEAQKTVSQTAADLAESVAKGDYGFMTEVEGVPATFAFESEQFRQMLTEAVAKAGGCTAQKGFSPDRYEHPVYELVAGDMKLCKLEFGKQEKSKYGFDRYELKKVSPSFKGIYALKVLVPENGRLYLNGFEVDDSYKTGEKRAENPPKYALSTGKASSTQVFYEISGLISEGTMKFVYDGSEEELPLAYENDIQAWTVKSHRITIEAPSNVEVRVNGVNVSADARFVSEKDIKIDSLKTSQKYVDNGVTRVVYTVSGIAGDAEVYGIAFNGEKVTPAYDNETLTYTFADGIRPSDLSLYGISDEWLLTRGVNYARFVNNDGNVYDIMLPYVQKGTDVYAEFEDFWVTFSRHNSYWVENKAVDLVEFYGQNLFKATVEFDYWIKGFDGRTDNTKSYHTVISFWYGKIDGQWKIIDWRLN